LLAHVCLSHEAAKHQRHLALVAIVRETIRRKRPWSNSEQL